MHQPCALLVFLLSCFYCHAQGPLDKRRYEDSMQMVLTHNKSDSVRAITRFRLSEYLGANDTAQAMACLLQGRKEAAPYPVLCAMFYYYEANLTAINMPDRAEELYLKADTLLRPYAVKEAWSTRSKAMHRYGVLRQQKDDPKRFADIMLHEAIPLAVKAGDSMLIGKNYLGIGYVFRNAGEYEKASAYMETAIKVFRAANVPVEQLIIAYHALAENYSLAGNNPQAKPLLDSSRVLLTPYPDSEHWLDYYAAEGLYYNTAETPALALDGLQKGITLAKKLRRRYAEQRLQFQLYYVFYNSQKYERGREVLLYLLQQKEMVSLATNRLLLYTAMAETNVALGNTSQAYQWQLRYSRLSDSINNSLLKREIHAMEIRYGQAENRQRITALEAAQKQAVLAGRNTRLTIWLLAAISCILVITVLFILFYNRNHKQLQLREMEQQRQLATSHAMIEGEERERSRLARDLHDGLGGMLAGMKIKLSGLNTGQEDRGGLHHVISQLDNSITELRQIARNMMPESLLKFGLETALKDLCASLMPGHTQIDFQAYNIEKNIPVNVQVTIYRIIQEALNNALRHSNASSILLQCSQNGHTFFITIEDDGVGFNTNLAHNSPGIGLDNIRNRIRFLNGKLDITSTINEGTVLNIELHVGEV